MSSDKGFQSDFSEKGTLGTWPVCVWCVCVWDRERERERESDFSLVKKPLFQQRSWGKISWKLRPTVQQHNDTVECQGTSLCDVIGSILFAIAAIKWITHTCANTHTHTHLMCLKSGHSECRLTPHRPHHRWSSLDWQKKTKTRAKWCYQGEKIGLREEMWSCVRRYGENMLKCGK